MDPYGCLHMQWFAFQEKNLELRELESCKLGSMLIFCSGGKYYLKMVCYTNLLEKTIQGKGQSMSLLPR